MNSRNIEGLDQHLVAKGGSEIIEDEKLPYKDETTPIEKLKALSQLEQLSDFDMTLSRV